MANSSVKVSFECMRVDITRGWLRGELFYDDGLKVLKDNYISPGPNILSKLMDPGKEYVAGEDEKLSREQLLQRYEMFPMYPTCAPPITLTLSCLPTDGCSTFQRSSSRQMSCLKSREKRLTSNPTSQLLPPPLVRTSDMVPSRSEVRTPTRAPRPPPPARRLLTDAGLRSNRRRSSDGSPRSFLLSLVSHLPSPKCD
ncbi:hypothetical protein BDM02DRAFT_317940 [Thelephora ganbajun]|uniref:Uncharacterized protein n=1 Tax=Thelephora ganbajun TaxID=370292 RepID=A0ACB6Z911_THEGA|nr:hypothetical protein BDM02DRAFT_317940 [Thelephora ganbajun]